MEKSGVININQIVENYSESAKKLKKLTTEIMEITSEGRLFSETLRSQLNDELDNIKEYHAQLCNQVHEIGKDIPENPSIHELAKIVEDYENLLNEFSEIEEILEKFVRVTSKEPKYANALRPYQDQALEIIEQIHNKTADKKIISSDNCIGAECFINALDGKNYADLDEETRDSLENIFKPKVISGLAANKYLPVSDDSAKNEQPELAQEPNAVPEPVKTEEPISSVETPKENTTAEDTNANLDNSENQQNQNTIEHKTRKTNLNGQPSMPESHIFELITPSVENFLMILSHIQIITPRQALGFCKNSSRFTSEKLNLRDMKKWFGEWSEKGLLSTITLPTGKEKIFCLPTDPLVGKTITPETEKEIISRLEKIDSYFHLFEKTKPVSNPKPNEPEAEQIETAKIEPESEEAIKPTAILETTVEAKKETETIQAEISFETSEPEKTIKSEAKFKPDTSIAPEKEAESEETIETETSVETEETTTETIETTDNDKQFLTKICEFISSDKIYCATAYAKAMANSYRARAESIADSNKTLKDSYNSRASKYENFYTALAYAVDDPMEDCTYLSSKIQKINVIEESKDLIEPLIISAAIRTFYSDQQNDFALQSLYDTVKGFKTIENDTLLENVIYKIFKFKIDNKRDYCRGLDFYVEQDNSQSFESKLNTLKKDAAECIEKACNFNEKTKHKRFLDTKKLIFAPKGEFIAYLNEVKSGNTDKDIHNIISEFLKTNFIKEDCSISIKTLDEAKISDYIYQFWDKAGEKRGKEDRSNIMGGPLSNINKRTKEALAILIRWVLLIDKAPNRSSEEANNYKGLRNKLTDDLKNLLENINDFLNKLKNNSKQYAGLKILEFTVKDIFDCIKTSSSMTNIKQYFYVDFLKTPDVILDENYIPLLDSFQSDPQPLQPEVRILKHISNIQDSSPEQFEKRLKYIFDNETYGSDYGSAELIFKYLENTQKETADKIRSKYEKQTIEEIIEKGKEYVKTSAEKMKKEFIGNIELADAYDQFDDNSIKDTILSNVNDYWYERVACQCFNYGFFHYLTDSYIDDIKNKARKVKEPQRRNNLEKFKNGKENIYPEYREKIAKRIEECLQDQNYTVLWLTGFLTPKQHCQIAKIF